MTTGKGQTTRQKVEAGLPRRRRNEFLFKTLGMLATMVGVLFLGIFFATLIAQGSSAFRQTFMQLDVDLSADVLAPTGELDLAYEHIYMKAWNAEDEEILRFLQIATDPRRIIKQHSLLPVRLYSLPERTRRCVHAVLPTPEDVLQQQSVRTSRSLPGR